MKNFFELFGFLSMACISAALIFIFIGGKKDGFGRESAAGFLPELGAESSSISATPGRISEHPMRISSTPSNKRSKGGSTATADTRSAEDRLKSLYKDQNFVRKASQEWKEMVSDAADEYNVSPKVLLAHVLVQSYLGDYSRSQLMQDAADHAGDRVKPANVAAKGYRYGWSMQKLLSEYDLARYFPGAVKTAAAASNSLVSAKKSTKTAPRVTKPIAKTNPAAEGFKNMVAKEYGFSSWAGMQKLADPDTKSEAARRVKSLMMASRVR